MNERIRVLHVVPDLDFGGLQQGVVRLTRHLSAETFEQAVCCLHEAGKLGDSVDPSTNIYQLRAGWHDPRSAVRLAHIIRKFRPDVIHTRNWSTWPDTAAARMLARKGRVIFSLHGWDADAPSSRLRAWACRRLARRTDVLCGVSAEAVRLFCQEVGLDPDRFHIVPNGVDTARFRPRSDGMAVRHELGVPPGAVVVGSVGRLAVIKDYGLLLRAVAALSHEGDRPIEIVLVGEGSERARLHALAAELGIRDRLHILGWRTDVERILGGMDIFVLPSRREGMNNAALEAMATGLPVIATAVGGNIELLNHPSRGTLVPRGNLPAMAQALHDWIRLPAERRRIGAAARDHVQMNYGFDRMLRQYDRLYRRAARPYPQDLPEGERAYAVPAVSCPIGDRVPALQAAMVARNPSRYPLR